MESLSGQAALLPRTSYPRPNPAVLLNKSICDRFGLKLRRLRLDRGYTQIQLADFLGIDRSFISDLERGKKNISIGYLQTIAQGFEISVADLLRDI